MDKNKIVELFKFIDKKKEKPQQSASSFSYQTNPIIERMMKYNLQSKQSKFSIKDLFK